MPHHRLRRGLIIARGSRQRRWQDEEQDPNEDHEAASHARASGGIDAL
jgi:hypothetical protein